MENLGKITMFFISIALAFLVSLLGTHIVLSIAGLYKLAFITQFSFVQIYGISVVFNIFKYKYTKEDEEKKTIDKIKNMKGADRIFDIIKDL